MRALAPLAEVRENGIEASFEKPLFQRRLKSKQALEMRPVAIEGCEALADVQPPLETAVALGSCRPKRSHGPGAGLPRFPVCSHRWLWKAHTRNDDMAAAERATLENLQRRPYVLFGEQALRGR